MAKQKQISTLAGIIIIAVAIVVLFGGVFACQYLVLRNQMEGHTVQISLDEATVIAQDAIFKNLKDIEFAIQKDKTIKKKYGWIFFVNTQKYLNTKNPSDLIPGIGPLVVDNQGHVQWLTTSVSPDRAIREYEKSLK